MVGAGRHLQEVAVDGSIGSATSATHARGARREVQLRRVHPRPYDGGSYLFKPAEDPSPLLTGKSEFVAAWLSKFPRTYFGVTAAAKTYDAHQLDGLMSIPRDRLLLESDSPYFPPEGVTIMHTGMHRGDCSGRSSAPDFLNCWRW